MPVWKPDCLRPNQSLYGATSAVCHQLPRDLYFTQHKQARFGSAVVEIRKRDGETLGLVLSGGADKSCSPFVSSIKPGGIASRGDCVQEGDSILSINAIRTTNLKHEEVVNLLKNVAERVILEMEYEMPQYDMTSRDIAYKTLDVTVEKEARGGFGITVRGGAGVQLGDRMPHVVTAVRQGAPVDRHGYVHVGDRLLTINGLDLAHLTTTEVMTYLQQCPNTATFTFEYQVSVMQEVTNASGALLIEIDVSHGGVLGVELRDLRGEGERFLTVAAIAPASIADRCGALHIDDQILSIDGAGVETMLLVDATRLLNNANNNVIRLEILPISHLQYLASCGSLPRKSSCNQSRVTISRTQSPLSDPPLPTQATLRPDRMAFSTDTLSQRSAVRRRVEGRRGDHMSVMSLASTTASVVTNINQICRSEVMVMSLRLEGAGGVGVALEARDPREYLNYHVIAYIEPGSVADRSGVLQAGDHLVKLNGQSVGELTVTSVVQLLGQCDDRCVLEVEFDVAESVQASCGTFVVKLAQAAAGVGIDMTASSKPSSTSTLVIRNVRKGSPAYRCGSIQAGDYILSINDVTTNHMTPGDAMTMLEACQDGILKLKLKREEKDTSASSVTYSVELVKVSEGLGMKMCGSSDHSHPIIVSHVNPGGLAHRTGLIHSGDQVLAINGVGTHNLNLYEAIQLLETFTESVCLKLSKPMKTGKQSSQSENRKATTPQPSGDSAMESWDSSGCDHPSVNVNKKMSRPRERTRKKQALLPLSYQDLGTTTDSMCNLVGMSNLGEVGQESGADWLRGDVDTAEHRDSLRHLGAVLYTSGSRSGSRHDTTSEDEGREKKSRCERGDRERKARCTESQAPSDKSSDTDPPAMNLYRMRLERSAVATDYGFCVSDGANARGVFISAVRIGGLAHSASLRPYDRLLQVNGVKFHELDSKRAVEIMKSSLYVDMIVCRGGQFGGSGNVKSVNGAGDPQRDSGACGESVKPRKLERRDDCSSLNSESDAKEACWNVDKAKSEPLYLGNCEKSLTVNCERSRGDRSDGSHGNNCEAKRESKSFSCDSRAVHNGGENGGTVTAVTVVPDKCDANGDEQKNTRVEECDDENPAVGDIPEGREEVAQSNEAQNTRLHSKAASLNFEGYKIRYSGGKSVDHHDDREGGCDQSRADLAGSGEDVDTPPGTSTHAVNQSVATCGQVEGRGSDSVGDVTSGRENVDVTPGMGEADTPLFDSNLLTTISAENEAGHFTESLLGDASIGLNTFIAANRRLYRSSTPKSGNSRGLMDYRADPGVVGGGDVSDGGKRRTSRERSESLEVFDRERACPGGADVRSYEEAGRRGELDDKSRRTSCSTPSRRGGRVARDWRSMQRWRQQHCENFEDLNYGVNNVHSM